ncbi:hypothetical protein [Paludibaculum fermentans]|uniref:Uncharacterized protein n=1 Tax=Paludibaculum fermentans TaxID=1473598 RepID=A0A7S7NU66_PALFE|nr:hypothetical protein [Paludibaculum fermentans]QOY89786.1 hypothetical protein IRI77_07490 [Paludibaculum fermentans]
MRFSLFRHAPALAGTGQECSSTRLPSLEYPLDLPPRVAVLGLSVRQQQGIHIFPEWNSQNLNKLRPTTLAGWQQDLEQVGRLCDSGHLALSDLNYPLLVFSTPEQGPLGEVAQAEMWRWSGVPVYEQIRTREGRLVAVECDTRNGFHLAEGSQAEGGDAPCNCGRGVRWLPALAESTAATRSIESEQYMAAAAGD